LSAANLDANRSARSFFAQITLDSHLSAIDIRKVYSGLIEGARLNTQPATDTFFYVYVSGAGGAVNAHGLIL